MNYNKLVSIIIVLVLISTAFSSFVLAAPSLISSISATPTNVNTGDVITVVMTVTNDGTVNMNNVTPSALTLGGTGSATYLSGPSPTSANIPSTNPDTSVGFTWTYTAGSPGTVNFTGNATSTSAGGTSSTATTSNNVTIIGTPAGDLTSSISATPIIVQPGETITVDMNVTNNSTVDLNVTPSALTQGGTGSATYLSGPSPTPPVELAPGESQTFTWTYTADSIGTDLFRTVNFTGNASGTDDSSSYTVESTSTTSNDVIIGYCDYTECFTVPFGAERNLNLNKAFQHCFPSADSGGLNILLGPFYGTAFLKTGDQQIRYTADNSVGCTEGPDWIIFEALDVHGGPIGYFKICINIDCGGTTFPTADDDSESVCSNACVNVSVLDGDTYTPPLTSIDIVNAPLSGTAERSGDKIYYCAQGVDPGEYNFNYSITDSIGVSNTAKVTITVEDCTPVARPDSATVCDNACVNVSVLDNDDNSSPATITIVDPPTSPASLRITSNNDIEYCANLIAPGTYNFNYSITDDYGTSNKAKVTITVNDCTIRNRPPTARDDYNSTTGTTCVIMSVLTNDSDPDQDILNITSVSDAAHGTVVVLDFENGIIQYCPEEGFCGTDSFTYYAIEADTEEHYSDIATVYIDVICEAPKEKVPAILLFPLVDIERLTLSATGIDIIVDGKVVANFGIVPGTQSLTAQVENRGFVTQNDVMVRFEGLPKGVTYTLTPPSQKIKAHNIGTYGVTMTVSPDTPQGTYLIKAVAYTRRGTLDQVEFNLIVD